MRNPAASSHLLPLAVAIASLGQGLVAQDPKPGTGEFQAYREKLPGSDVGFDMLPIAGGTFRMGSVAGEAGRGDDEGPQVEVALEPFWMGKCEVTWAEYDVWNTDTSRPQSKKPDGVARPTPPYMDMTFNMGRDGFPAICMSQIAAREYCRWLSDKTGHFYRLPTEAEWEYACRAGTTTAYSFGDDPKALGDYAWFADNSARVLEPSAAPVPAYHPVGQKKPNPWGLFDMHGNVAEWVADQYYPDAYAPTFGTSPRKNPYLEPSVDKKDRPIRYPHVVRGGSWGDEPAKLRSAARLQSAAAWNSRDPQIPKSWWYVTEGQHIGFRVVRPLHEPIATKRAAFEDPRAQAPDKAK